MKMMVSWLLFIVISLLVVLLLMTANCAEGKIDGTLDLVACSGTIRTWYAVLSPWQGGLGAGIGLLGVAWAHHFVKANEGNQR